MAIVGWLVEYECGFVEEVRRAHLEKSGGSQNINTVTVKKGGTWSS